MSGSIEEFQQKALEAHNHMREHHQSHTQPQQRMYKGSQMGENIAMKFDSRIKEFTGGSATKQWYSEIKDYDFATGDRRGVVGHFTQVVWKESREFGIGRAKAADGAWYVCANYHPAGNMMGKNKENVMSPKDGQPCEIEDEDPLDDTAAESGEWSMGVPLKLNTKDAGQWSMGVPLKQNTNGSQAAPAGVRKVSTSTKTQTKVVNGVKTVTKIITKTTENPDGSVETETTTETV